MSQIFFEPKLAIFDSHEDKIHTNPEENIWFDSYDVAHTERCPFYCYTNTISLAFYLAFANLSPIKMCLPGYDVCSFRC
jgi:hypothetical protein